MYNPQNIPVIPDGDPDAVPKPEVKRGRGRPRKTPLPDPSIPKRGRGRPKKTYNLSSPATASSNPTPANLTPPSLTAPNWGSGDSVDQFSRSTYPVVFDTLTRQKAQFEAISDAMYLSIVSDQANSKPIDKTLLQTYEQYQQRLRQVVSDLSALGKSRLDELKIQAHLKEQSESKVTQLIINLAPPPPPVDTPYNAEDYRKAEDRDDDVVIIDAVQEVTA